ncbi:UPF0246 protein YaaA [Hydrogenimonas sp.]|nr:UPF0246 protein YaaA [Hydrogenimonas sp.]
MTILFAPSEAKKEGGSGHMDRDSFCLPDLYDKRVEAAERYNEMLKNGSMEEISKLTGIKDEKQLERYRTDIFTAPVMRAAERYDGVAYSYLEYTSLTPEAQRYVDEHLLIFSNLFGPIRAKDLIPDYKLKQGEHIGSFAPEKFYREHFTQALDDYLSERGPVVDLRAGFYEKFYKLSMPSITMKFLKNGKSVSHWAKAYRGRVLKEMAKRGIMDEESLLAMDIENLAIVEIKQIKNRKEIVYEIVQ